MEMDQKKKSSLLYSLVFFSKKFHGFLRLVVQRFLSLSLVRQVRKFPFLFLLFSPTNKRQYGTNSVASSLGFVVVPVRVEQVGLSINHFVVVILCPNEATSPTLFLVFSRIEECKQRICMYRDYTRKSNNKTIC